MSEVPPLSTPATSSRLQTGNFVPNSIQLPVALLYSGFVLTGAVTTLLGPMLPILSRRFHLSDSRAGLFFVAQFVASTLGAIVTAKLLSWSTRDRLLAGYMLLTLGVPGMMGNWATALAGVSCYGFGLGLVIPTTNISVAESSAKEIRGSALNVLNFAWVCGAVMCGPLLRTLSEGTNPTKFLLVVTGALGAIAAGFLFNRGSPLGLIANNSLGLESRQESKRELAVALWFGLLFFLYVGLENSIAGWASSYSERLGIMERRALLVPSFFWTAILAGRLLTSVVLKRTSEYRLFRYALLLATAGIALMVSAHDPVVIILAIAICGFGLAPLFPLVILFFTQALGSSSSKFAGRVFALGGLGGALLPFATGALSTRFQSLRFGLTACLAAVVCFYFVYWRLNRNNLRVDSSFASPHSNAG